MLQVLSVCVLPSKKLKFQLYQDEYQNKLLSSKLIALALLKREP